MEEKISKSQIVEFFRRAGWYENRKVDISEIERYYQECNYPMFESTKKFFQEFYGLNQLLYETNINLDGGFCDYYFNLIKDFDDNTFIDIKFETKIYDFKINQSLEPFTLKYIKSVWHDDCLIKTFEIYEPIQYIGFTGSYDSHEDCMNTFIGKSGRIYRPCYRASFKDIINMVTFETNYHKNFYDNHFNGTFEIF